MSEVNGIIGASVLDGEGGGTPLHEWDEVRARWNGDRPLWLHLHLDRPEARRWLAEESGLDAIAGAALYADEPRPRCDPHGEGLIVCLRGVNLNPGADPEDMISVRLWVDARHVVTVRRERVMAVNDIREDIVKAAGPRTTGEFLADLAFKLVARMGPVLAELDDRVDALEDVLLTARGQEIRTRLGGLRREAIALRRYIAPQREAMNRLILGNVPWIGRIERDRLREVMDRITRYVEDLDAARERAAIMQDEISNRVSEQINRNMYILSVVAAMFLPLGFITGLLGINVGGIPGEGVPWAFVAVCLVLGLLVAGEILIFRRLKWL